MAKQEWLECHRMGQARQARVEPVQPAPCDAFETSWSWGQWLSEQCEVLTFAWMLMVLGWSLMCMDDSMQESDSIFSDLYPNLCSKMQLTSTYKQDNDMQWPSPAILGYSSWTWSRGWDHWRWRSSQERSHAVRPDGLDSSCPWCLMPLLLFWGYVPAVKRARAHPVCRRLYFHATALSHEKSIHADCSWMFLVLWPRPFLHGNREQMSFHGQAMMVLGRARVPPRLWHLNGAQWDFQRCIAWYRELNKRRPYSLAFGMLSGKAVLCDAFSQAVLEGHELDKPRMLSAGLFGGLWQGCGQYFVYNVAFTSLIGGGTCTKTVLKKLAADCFIHTPFMWLPVNLSMYEMIKNGSLNRVPDRWRSEVIPTMKVYCMVWPGVNFLNFMFVPMELRMTVIFFASIFWYLGATYVTHGSAHRA